MAKRIQMTRQKPWRKDNPDAVIVDRKNKSFGNPFKIGEDGISDAAHAVREFERLMRDNLTLRKDAVIDLRGKDLACWCALDSPCHADVLLRIANAPSGVNGGEE